MADNANQNRTEAATPRRREEARKKGLVATSADLSAGLLLLAGVLLMWLGGTMFGGHLMGLLKSSLLFSRQPEWGTAETASLAGILFEKYVHMLGLVVGGLFVAGVVIGALQAGIRFTARPLVPDWERISPSKGWSRLMSSRGVMRGLSAVAKAAAVAAVMVAIFRNQFAGIAASSHATLDEAVHRGWHLTLLLALAVAGAIILIGLFDYVYQRWRYEQELRMTRQEFEDELKEHEGDPLIRARIRKLQREMREQRSIQDVPQASVVITNPTHFAVALQYDRATMTAPKVIAKGADAVARRIIAKAREHGVHVVENKPLARALFATVDVGRDIPVELYYAVAEILAYVHRAKHAA